MSPVRESLAAWFERWGGFVVRHPWLTLLPALAVTLALGSRLPSLEVDTTVEGFLHADDPMMIAYDDFRSRFGRDDPIVIG